MQQWVDIETRGVDVSKAWNKPFSLDLQFEAVNNTPFLLTINKIETTIALWADSWEEFTIETWDRLPPAKDGKSSGHSFYVETSMETKEGFEKGTLFAINHRVTFTDCLGKTRTQWFNGLYDCRPEHFERMKYMGIVPDKEEKKTTQYSKSAETPWLKQLWKRIRMGK